jgi:hypothetical protein
MSESPANMVTASCSVSPRCAAVDSVITIKRVALFTVPYCKQQTTFDTEAHPRAVLIPARVVHLGIQHRLEHYPQQIISILTKALEPFIIAVFSVEPELNDIRVAQRAPCRLDYTDPLDVERHAIVTGIFHS